MKGQTDMSDGTFTGIICPNDPDHGQMYIKGSDRVCVIEECGYAEPHSSIHDDDTKEIVRVVDLCEGCQHEVFEVHEVVVKGQKVKLCRTCATQRETQLDSQNGVGEDA